MAMKLPALSKGQPEASAWKLVIQEPAVQPRTLQYQQAVVTIGRSPQCDLQLQDAYASSEHARITASTAGLYLLTDLKSANGTWVNGRPVSEVYVRPGDQITIGRSSLAIYAEPTVTTSSQEITSVLPIAVKAQESIPHNMLLAANRIQKTIAQELPLTETLNALLNIVCELFEANVGHIILYNDSNHQWEQAANLGASSWQQQPNQAVIKQVLENGQTLFCADTIQDSSAGNWQGLREQQVRTVMCAALNRGKNIQGVLYMDRRGPSRPNATNISQGHREIFESILGFATLAINQTRLQESLSKEIRTRTAMQRYLSPQVVEQVMQQKHQYTLGGSLVRATVLFSDIRGFTKFSSTLEPKRLIQQLNEYFSVMAKVIIANHGYLDKFIGDAIMAVYGVPTAQKDDAKNAIESALEMHRRLESLNAEWQQRGWQPFDMGIGINTGNVISGNIGSTQRMEYTVLGDDVNVASRLCSAAQACQIVVADATKTEAGNSFSYTDLDVGPLKGKEDSVVKAYLVNHKR